MTMRSAHSAGPLIGLDIGGTKVLGVLLGPGDGVRATVRLPTVRGVDGVVTTAAKAVRALLDEAAIDRVSGVRIGVGVPGVVDPGTGIVTHAVNLDFPAGPIPLADRLSAALDGAPVQVENDLNVAALGMAGLGSSPGGGAPESHPVDDLAFLALGTGIAAGFVLDGRVRRGAFGAAGEIGHLPYLADGALCACGQRGCLELYASGAALDARWPSSDGVPAPVALFAAAAAGELAAIEVRDVYVRAVAAAIRILVLTTDVRRVFLGGGVSELGAPLLDAVVAALDAQAVGSEFLASLALGRRVRLAPAGVPVAAIGAALLARGTVTAWK